MAASKFNSLAISQHVLNTYGKSVAQHGASVRDNPSLDSTELMTYQQEWGEIAIIIVAGVKSTCVALLE